MPATIDQNGVTIPTQAEVRGWILNGYTANDGTYYPGWLQIFGAAINVDSNAPDGQRVNIIAQIIADLFAFAKQGINSFNPSVVQGILQDQLYAINSVIRQGGTYTQQAVSVTANQSVSLPGLDTAPNAPFTVSDSAGNKYQLLATTAVLAGTVSLPFEAAALGAVASAANSITTIVTATVGITAVNNPGAASSVGVNQEMDTAYRVRRENSVELPSLGYYDGLRGALIDITGVNQVWIDENDTMTTNSNGTPGNCIWVVIDAPSSLNAAIAQTIYLKRSMGCNTRGTIAVNVTRPSGAVVSITFDNPTAVQLYFKATITTISGPAVDKVWLAAQIQAAFAKYQIAQSADSSSIVAFIKSVAPTASVSAEGVSLTSGSGFTTLLAPAAVNDQFQIGSVGNIALT